MEAIKIKEEPSVQFNEIEFHNFPCLKQENVEDHHYINEVKSEEIESTDTSLVHYPVIDDDSVVNPESGNTFATYLYPTLIKSEEELNITDIEDNNEIDSKTPSFRLNRSVQNQWENVDKFIKSSCPTNDKNVSSSESNDVKKRMNNSNEKSFKCTVCDYSSTRMNLLKRHMTKHIVEKLYKCADCDYSSVIKRYFREHIRKHTEEKPYKCTMCEYSSFKLKYLKTHIRSHTGEKPYKCNECDYSTTDASYLKLHVIRKHTGEKSYKAIECVYSTDLSNEFKKPINGHTDENLYKCNECNYATFNQNTLKMHKKKHTNKKPYKCTHCKYSSVYSFQLKRHTRRHSGEKHHKCNECDYSTSDANYLKIHIIRKHTGKKKP